MPVPGIGISPIFRWWLNSGAVYNQYTQDWISRVTSEGGTVTDNEAVAVDTYVTSKAWFLEMDRFFPHFCQDPIAARTSIANAATADLCTAVNSPTHTPGEGYQGNGSTSYLDTNYNPSTDGVKYTLNNASIYIYSRTNIENDRVSIGGRSNTGFYTSLFFPKYTALSGIFYLNNLSTPPDVYNGASDSLGLIGMQRVISTEFKTYKAGVNTSTGVVNSNSVPNCNFFILGYDSEGSLTSPDTRQIAISSIGSGNIIASDMYTDIQDLATDLGFNV